MPRLCPTVEQIDPVVEPFSLIVGLLHSVGWTLT